jgi:hypothetical protein
MKTCISLVLVSLFFTASANAAKIISNSYSILKGSEIMRDLAVSRCAGIGGRIPSALEIAKILVSHGAIIKETAYPGVSLDNDAVKAEEAEMIRQGYQVIVKYGLIHDGVNFYFNSIKYNPGDLRYNFKAQPLNVVWTKTHSSRVFPADYYYYAFDLRNGAVTEIKGDTESAYVLCMQNSQTN